MRGAITQYIDVAQILLYAFWIFFAGLIVYLRREDKREGYPLESDRSAAAPRVEIQGFPRRPALKFFRLAHGGTAEVPNLARQERDLAAQATGPWPGAPWQPIGNPMLAGVGPGAHSARSDVPDLTFEGHPRIVPMRIADDFTIAARDSDPRGMSVRCADGSSAGVVRDLWVDRSEPQIRYLEVEVPADTGTRAVLLPMGFARFDLLSRCVRVRAILAEQFAQVPGLANPDQITLLEEDRITAYFGGGTLYATPARSEPLL